MSVLSPSLNVFVVVAQFYPDISDLQFKSVESFFKKHDFNTRSINYSINYIENSISQIKHIIENDTL